MPLRYFANAKTAHFSNAGKKADRDSLQKSGILFRQHELDTARQQIAAWPGYQPTPLLHLTGLATELEVSDVLYKDEGGRFGLGSFKALGGAYAVSRLAATEHAAQATVVATATDGNHGLSVAWGARNHGIRAIVYIHAGVSAGREQALKTHGAEVIRVAGNYDDSVRACYAEAELKGWSVISDTTSGESGHEVARTVMRGYAVMLAEISDQLAGAVPTHVFVQGGVGGLAATVCECFRLAFGERAPRLIVVEPELAPCLYRSAENNRPVVVEIAQETVMAGLSCGEVSAVAWPILRDGADDFLTIADDIVAPAMKLMGQAPFADKPVIAGESAVAGLAGLLSARLNAALSENLQLNADSRILVIGTEGATDPAVYEKMTGWHPAKI